MNCSLVTVLVPMACISPLARVELSLKASNYLPKNRQVITCVNPGDVRVSWSGGLGRVARSLCGTVPRGNVRRKPGGFKALGESARPDELRHLEHVIPE